MCGYLAEFGKMRNVQYGPSTETLKEPDRKTLFDSPWLRWKEFKNRIQLVQQVVMIMTVNLLLAHEEFFTGQGIESHGLYLHN
jgi:hypothetical protein